MILLDHTAGAEATVALPEQKEFANLPKQLAQYLHQASFPLLALHRLAVDRALDTEVQVFARQRYLRAQEYALQILEGLQAILPTGHPVRAVQHAVLARLMSIGPDGLELQDDRLLVAAYRQLQLAHQEAQIAFGKKGILVKQLGEELASFERDLGMRQRLYR